MDKSVSLSCVTPGESCETHGMCVHCLCRLVCQILRVCGMCEVLVMFALNALRVDLLSLLPSVVQQ